jgi:para-aminobenzoate synthetase / 4-amino-4-deoxychorismate lyase
MVAREGQEFIRRELPGRHSPVDVLRLLRQDAHPFALTGSWAGGRAIVGSQPTAKATPPQPISLVLGPNAGPDIGVSTRPARPGPSLSGNSARAGFAGGWVGYLGYGARPDGTPSPGGPRQLPLWWFCYYDHVLVREPDTGEWFFEALVAARREAEIEARYCELAGRMQSARPSPKPYRCGEFSVIPAPDAHRRAVAHAVELIHAGDMFQANITLRLEAAFSGDPLDLFCRGVEQLRPQYAAFLGVSGGQAVASFSPELFLRRTGTTVTTSPIKGTSSRSTDCATAERQRKELTASAKNMAENVMIVDLMRSDLSGVCTPGSVTVPRLAAAEPHPGIWHLVSDVRGELAEPSTDGELVAATFPPGSVTGAPKVRAMEVIHELEVMPREVYTGAIGYRSPQAGLELNVAIRTFEFATGRVWLGAGGGIVADSEPAAEYAECLLKAGPLIDAVGGRFASDPGQQGPPATSEAHVPTLRPRPALGVFTTLPVTAGVADGLGEHLARLAGSARELFGKELPPGLAGQIRQCLAAGGSGWLRITVRPVGGPLQCAVELAAPGPDPAAVRLQVMRLPGGLGGHKWADRRLLEDRITAAGLAGDEQLLLTDADGSVLETDCANIFGVFDGVLRTPPADGRIVPGIHRARVLAAASQVGLPVDTGSLRLADLPAASEIFVTNSVRGICPVLKLDEPEASWLPGPTAARLRAAVGARADQEQRPQLVRSVSRQRYPTGPGRSARAGGLIVLIDNYDSFTYNLAHLLLAAGCQLEVIRNDEASAAEVAGLGAAGVVISPGPCAPAQAGICVDLIRALDGKTPLLGVCLGHEAIAVAYGATIKTVTPVHGKATLIEHDGLGIFAGLPARFAAARYHSLLVAEPALPDCLTVSARTAGGLPMAIRHRSHPVDGVQFHPESILTSHGSQLIGNFLRHTADRA